MQLLIGTQNPGKIAEYRQLFQSLPVDLIGLDDVGLGHLDVEETGTTFLENVEIKVRAYAFRSGMLTLADDSGLAVDALDGRPGIYSARYGGREIPFNERRAKLLAELVSVPDEKRTAQFICVTQVMDPKTNTILTVEGICHGYILHEERDNGTGFGYDPIFQPIGYAQSFGEMDAEQKNKISHRGIASEKIANKLLAYLGASATST